MTNKIADSMIEQGIEQASNAWEEQMKEISAPLKKCAEELIRLAPATALLSFDAKGSIAKRRNELIQSINADPDKVIDAVQNYVKAKEGILEGEALRNYTNKKLKFWHKLNEFLGQQVKTVFVYKGRGALDIVLAEIDSSQVVREDIKRHTMRYSYDKNSNVLKQAIETARDTQSKEDEKNSKNLKLTFREVLFRAKRFKEKVSILNKSKQQEDKVHYATIIMWLENSTFQKMRVSSSGDLSEAYAAFYLNRQFKLFGIDLEKNVGTFMTSYPNGVKYVDSISGLLQGDVLANGIEYSVKSLGGSVMGDNDILTIASIIASEGYFTATMAHAIKETLKGLGTYRNKLVDSIDDTVDTLLEDLSKELTSNKSTRARAKKLT